MRKIPALLLLLVLSVCPRVLCAQSTNASITGRVTDPSKASVPEAKVAAVNLGTNFRYESTSNGAGEYTLSNLPPGTYRMEVEKSGFKKLIRPDVNLHVQDALAIDFEMTLGGSAETVTVEGGAPLINTESATVSTVVDQTFVENIPLNGRSFQTLILLTPGVALTQAAQDDQGQFSVNGQRADANYFTVDGVSANFGVTGYSALVQVAGGALPALSAQGGTNSLVSVEAMQEFRIQTSSFAPEFGRTPGGQISIVTRSGTNQFHGTAYEYFRNDVLDANNWFANANHLPKPEERQNDFGGIFGGPIFKDKTFFFFSYEGLRLRQPATQESVVPDTASRLQAPSTMQPYLNAYPIPNGSELGGGTAQFNGSYSNPSTLNAYSIRVDHAINSKLTLFGRYNYSPSETSVRDPFGSLSDIEMFPTSVQTFTLGLTESITPAISNEVRANYSNERVRIKYRLDSFGGAVPLSDSAVFPSGFSSANSFFQFVILGVGDNDFGKIGANEQRQVNLVDNLSWTKGSHQLKFGVDYRWLSPFTSALSYSQTGEFSGVSSCVEPCTEQAGFALSGTSLASNAVIEQTVAFLSRNISLYGQDTWKLSPRLTLTYGLRWDINPVLKGKDLASEPFTVVNLDDPANLALAPRGTPLYQTRYGNVAPRVGIAYQFGGRSGWETVLRGGFGIFYDLGQGALGGASCCFPFETAKLLLGAPFPLSAANAAPPAPTTNPPVGAIAVADPHLKTPRTYEWNVALEQSLGRSQSVSVTYVGAIGRDLSRSTELFNPNPDFQEVNVTDSLATSDYHALQLKFQRRLSHGLQALASYTFAHSIDIASTDAFISFLATPSFIANPHVDRGNSDFDIRHSFTAGVTYDLPAPRWNEFARATLGGWSVDTFVLARSAPPVDVVGALSFTGFLIFPRPNLVPGVPLELFGSRYPGGKAFNNAVIKGACPGGANQIGAFCPAPAGTQGDFGRNVLRGFGATQADVAFQRQFAFTEQLHLQFRGEFFNIFNHPNFGPPNNSLPSPLFGQSTQTLGSSLAGLQNSGFNPLYQVGGPRSIQLALKLAF